MANDDGQRPGKGRYDDLLKQIDWYLDRLCLGLLIVSIPISQARLPHSHDIVLAALSCAMGPVLFALVVKLGKRAGLIGQDTLADKRDPDIVDEGPGIARPPTAIIEREATMNARLTTPNSGRAAGNHQGFVAGVGAFTYRMAERRSGEIR